ncbi:multiple epidermal growth factor-like domains protein 10 [Saccostrea echinata]|uniref:multiple epidermal growth factor-like domains protein 10 n=1 Tax=Saccostrea echinata TaxID=191078 RepID=UPI002A80ECBD|nr:multiple epidermal growth factor-like domains protein 10 [Saccostrea echinata]
MAHTPNQNLQGIASWNVAPHESSWTADKAVDGNTNQTYLPTCAIAAFNINVYKSVWWKVWLTRKFNIAYLEIYLRSGTTSRATGFSLYTYEDVSYNPPFGDTGSLVYRHDPMSGCPVSIYNITVNKLAQGIAFFNERPDGFTSSCLSVDILKTTIDICEVRVMGCDQNRYHFGCTDACSDKCKNRHCDAFNGSCIYGCFDPNAVSLDCIVCDNGTYALNGRCVQCGHCKHDTPCDKGTGRCLSGCEENWTGDLCKECVDGFYDKDCSRKCGNCLEGVCDKTNGTCMSGCSANWQKPLCQKCIDGFYDQNCSTKCGECQSEFCDKENGSCLNGCKTNWKEPLCQECIDGFYDQNCSTMCGECREGFCDKKNGNCLNGCKTNWKEPLCQECANGLYDESCNLQCGNCIQGICDKKKGTCTKGCLQDWQGPMCNVYTTRESRTGEEFSKTSLVVISVISTLLGVILLSALTIVIYLKRTRCLQQNAREHSNTDHLSSKDTEEKYDELTGGKEDHHYTSINSTNRESVYQEIHTYGNSEFNEVI